MNVDKFGNHVHKRLRLSNIFNSYENALQKSTTGEYDLKQTRLVGLLTPMIGSEAVNKDYLDNKINEELIKNQNNVSLFLKDLQLNILKELKKNYYTKAEINKILKNDKTRSSK